MLASLAITDDTMSAATVQEILYANDPKVAITLALALTEKANDATSA